MPSLPSRAASSKPKHAKPSTAAAVATPVAAGGALTAGMLVAGASSAQAAASDAQLAALRQCESGGNYRANTGNGYYGAYQFSPGTWRGIGYSGMPHTASPDTQDQAARDLQARSGWGQWPACSRKLGLRGGGGGGNDGGSNDRASRGGNRTTVTPSYTVPKTAPMFRDDMVIAAGAKYSPQVKAWQARMKQRGWKLTADGLYGPKSASVAKKFAAEKRLAARPGTLNKAVFVGAWKLAVT